MFVDIGAGIVQRILDMGQPAAVAPHQIGVTLRADRQNDCLRFDDRAVG
jgi:hypothetical protein